MNNNIVFAWSDNNTYPKALYQFRPSKVYPEYPYKEDLSPDDNFVYDLFREALLLGGYDQKNYGTEQWNPLKNIVSPYDTVLIKPNFVMDHNPTGEGVECLITQPGLIAAAVDYVIIAFQGKPGKIIIGDAPMQECNFENLINTNGLDTLINYYKEKGIDIQLIDFRGLKSTVVRGIYHSEEAALPKGKIIDLGEDSEFFSVSEEKMKRLRITNYNPTLLSKHHSKEKHEYFISDYLLSADAVINMPKPKTHRKAGITGALKNMVGINVRKEYLPHHTMGAKSSHEGDEYLNKDKLKELSSLYKDKQNYAMSNGNYARAQLMKSFARLFFYADRIVSKDQFSQGSWYGNETISRTICDLNKILLYSDKNGVMQDTIQRKIFIVADMIVSGEKEGPVEPSSKNVGIIALGENSLLFDECLAPIMGVDAKDIPTLRQARTVKGKCLLAPIETRGTIISNRESWNNKSPDQLGKKESLMYLPSSGWRKVFYSTMG